MTRQVVQRALPPHTEACGMPFSRKVSSTVAPGRIGMVRPLEWVRVGGRRMRKIRRRPHTAANVSPTRAKWVAKPILAQR